MTGFVHPRLLSSLAKLFDQRVTIQQAIETQDPSGQPVCSWQDVYASLPCRLAPTGGQETRLPEQIYAISTHTISIAGYYPDITAKMRAVIDAIAYDILNVGCDSEHLTTRLNTRILT